MIIIHNLAEEKSRTRLENAHIVEKCEKKIEETESPENFDNMDLKAMANLTLDLAQIEMKGISDYIIQLFTFINGYKVVELPYIIHALKKITEKLMEVCKETDKKAGENTMQEKVDILWKMYGDSKIVLERVAKPENKKNEEE